MAQDVKIANITYSDVPAIEIPKATTGTALFTDTSPTTAVASDVASGKYFFTASGQLTLGSASGGTAAISVVDTTDTAGGTIRTITALDISDTTAVASDVASGKYFYTADGTKTAGTASGGGGGLEYETGTWTPTEDVTQGEILFTNTHSQPPFFFVITDNDGDSHTSIMNTNAYAVFADWNLGLGTTAYPSSSSTRIATLTGARRTTQVSSLTDVTLKLTSSENTLNYATNEGIYPYLNASGYWRSGYSYKWIAIWAPTT